MRVLALMAAAIAIAAFDFASAAEQDREAQFLSNTRQLTFEGKRSGEAYFSPDGKALAATAKGIGKIWDAHTFRVISVFTNDATPLACHEMITLRPSTIAMIHCPTRR